MLYLYFIFIIKSSTVQYMIKATGELTLWAAIFSFLFTFFILDSFSFFIFLLLLQRHLSLFFFL